MTPSTTARPTIVRTRPPPPELGAACLADCAGRFSGVDSPFAANATGASSTQPKTAVPADKRAWRIVITEGTDRAWIGLSRDHRPPHGDLERARSAARSPRRWRAG